MKILELFIENFKSFNGETIKDLSDINMIFGYNNTGKSNLLKFIDLLFQRKRASGSITTAMVGGSLESYESKGLGNFWEGIIENHPFIFQNGNKNNEIKYKCCVELDREEINNINLYGEQIISKFSKGATPEYLLFISGSINSRGEDDANMKLDEVTLNGVIIFEKPDTYFGGLDNNDEFYNNEEVFIALLDIMNDSVLFLDNDRNFVLEEEEKEINEISSKKFKNWFFNLSLNHTQNAIYSDLLNSLNKFKTNGNSNFQKVEKSSPFNDLKIEFARVGKKLELMFTNEFNRYPISSFGTGIHQILYILTRIFYAKPKILLIEEIELNLSHKYQFELLQFINKLIHDEKLLSQLFFTTHSPLFCYRSDYKFLKVEINEKGETKIIKPAQEEMQKYIAAKNLLTID